MHDRRRLQVRTHIHHRIIDSSSCRTAVASLARCSLVRKVAKGETQTKKRHQGLFLCQLSQLTKRTKGKKNWVKAEFIDVVGMTAEGKSRHI